MPYTGPPLAGPAPLDDLLKGPASDQPEAIALVVGDRVWTRRQLKRDIDTLATHLIALGLQPGDRIASLVPNCGELLVYFLAGLKAGLILTPLNYRYTPPEIDYALAQSQAKLLFVHAERAADVAASRLAGNMSKGLISVEGTVADSRPFADLTKSTAPDVQPSVADDDAPAFIFMTSGSTGKPKGVTHSIATFGSVAASFAQGMQLGPQDIVFPGGSISHVGALSTALAALSVGARVILAANFDAPVVLHVLRTQRPTVLVALPAALIAVQHDQQAARDDFSSLRLCITGGDKFPIELERQFFDLTGLDIRETYGLTEATDCLFDPPDGVAREGSAGLVCPGYEASLRDESGSEIAAGIDGNLWLRGAPVFQGYWNNPDATRDAFSNGWFDTGDVMQVDADGYFWFVARKKQIIVHDGSNISPQEIEEAVLGHPALALAGVVGVRDTVHGENVWAYVTVKPGAARPSAQDVIEGARRQVGYKAPEVVVFLEEMPLNATGKVDRLALKTMAAERVGAKHIH